MTPLSIPISSPPPALGALGAVQFHQGLENRLIKPSADVIPIDRPVKKRERLGGVLNYYYREAA